MMESIRRDTVAKEISAEFFVQQVELQLQAKAHGVDMHMSMAKAPPGLAPKLSEKARQEAHTFYKKLLAN